MDQELHEAFLKQKLSGKESIIKETFGGETISKITCSKCSYTSDRHEPFLSNYL